MVTELRRMSRREALKGSILLPVTVGLSISASSSGAQQAPSNTKVLIAYFSRTGNTRVIAGQIRRALGADLFEIEPAEAYPEDYDAVVSSGTKRARHGLRAASQGDGPEYRPLRGGLPRISHLGNDLASGDQILPFRP